MKRPITTALVLALVGSTVFVIAGCHRGYYRREADAEARQLIYQKMNDPRWDQIDPSISVAPDSRMHDPFSADHPPLPPDDPASHALMECTDGKPNYPHWHANGDTHVVENPHWRSFLPINEQGIVEIDLDTAIRLSLIHSDDYQSQKETLYLSALDVSLERFGFDTQAFASWNSFYRTNPAFAGSESSSLWDLVANGSRVSFQRAFTTGANLIVGFANSISWELSGANNQSGTALLDVLFTQPLLRGAGRDRIMESLTQSERNLLADVRQMERYRRGFYLNIATGRSAGAGPGSNFLSEPGFGTTNVGGYLGLLLNQQEIRISEFNVRQLQSVINQFREFFNEQRIDAFQVRLAESSLYDAQSGLLQDKVSYENSLDQFKRDLGLPPDLDIIISDPFLEQFELIHDDLLQRQFEVNALRDRIGLALTGIDASEIMPQDPDANPTDRQLLAWNDDLRQSLEAIKPMLDEVAPLRETVLNNDVNLILSDFNTLEAMYDERVENLHDLAMAVQESEIDYDVEPQLFEADNVENVEALRAELQTLLERFDEIAMSVDVVKASIDDIIEKGPGLDDEALTDRVENEVLFEAPDILTKFANMLIEFNLLQARARTDSIVLPDMNLSSEEAIAIARCFRRDWMNARAALVDQWRLIEFFADDLESTLDLEFNGSVGNFGDNPFDLRWDSNQFNMGFRFDAPITRVAERNRYRQALIDYQQTRRQYYNFEDSIKQNLRQTIRQLEQSRVLFELNRRSIKIAVQRVETSQLALIEPVAPGQGGGALGPTAADNLTSSINALQQAQNQFLRVWVGFEAARRGLDFDLGTMLMTQDGYWLDPGVIDESIARRAADSYGLPLESLCMPVNGESGYDVFETVPLIDHLSPEPTAPAPIIDENAALGPVEPVRAPVTRSKVGATKQPKPYRPIRLTAVITEENTESANQTVKKVTNLPSTEYKKAP